MTKKALVAELAESRNQLYAALRDLPEEALKKPNTVDGYSIADLCGLISAWENRLLTLIQQISQGDEDKVDDANVAGLDGAFYADHLYDNSAFNAAQQRRRRHWPWREILQELVWTREETGWTLANMDESAMFTQHSIETEDRGVISVCPAGIVRQLIALDRARAAEIQQWRQQHQR